MVGEEDKISWHDKLASCYNFPMAATETAIRKEVVENSENPYFDIIAKGHFPKGHVVLAMEDPRPEHPDFFERWRAQGSKINKTRPILTIPASPRIENDILYMTVAPSTFRAHDATRDPNARLKYHEYLADALGTSVVIVTADEKIAVAQRQIPLEHRGRMGVVSGYPRATHDPVRGEPVDIDQTGTWDPFRTVSRELAEEAGIGPHELSDLTALGVIVNRAADQPVMVFAARTSLSSDTIRQRDTDDEVRIRFAPHTENALSDLLPLYASYPSPTGMGSLMLFGDSEFGHRWSERMNARLTREYWKQTASSDSQKAAIRQWGLRQFTQLAKT
jgi:hypothetical protein